MQSIECDVLVVGGGPAGIATAITLARAGRAVTRVVGLVHTEGCGASGGDNEAHFTRTLVGHLVHPFVRRGLLLEHGCEKIHNDAMRIQLREHGVDLDRFGWASVQMDGGIGF